MLTNRLGSQETNIPDGLYTQSMTGKLYSCLELIPWTEITNDGSKLKSVWLAILMNEKQFLSHIHKVNNVYHLIPKINSDANMKQRNKIPHADCTTRQVELDERAVQDIH